MRSHACCPRTSFEWYTPDSSVTHADALCFSELSSDWGCVRPLPTQARLRKLRLFAGPVAHGFARDACIPWEMPPRNLRNKKHDTELFELPEGEIPLDYRGFKNAVYEALGEDGLIPLHIGDPTHTGRKP